jgi:hypothetical protein
MAGLINKFVEIFNMKALAKFFLPLIATLALAGCGGGGGGGSSGSAFEPPKDTVTISPGASSITTNNYTTLTVIVKKQDGTAEADGTTISASLSPATLGSISSPSGTAGATATNTLSGGTTSFFFNSATNTGTATITVSLAPINGNPNSVTASVSITVTQGTGSDPRLQLVPSTTTLPLNPYGLAAGIYPFPTNYIGSPYISQVTVQWRHSNGQLVSGNLKANVSITPSTVAWFSFLDDFSTVWTGQTLTPPTSAGNEFLTTYNFSTELNVTAGVGVVFVHSSSTPGSALLTVTAIDPDNGQTISSPLTFTVTGAATNLLPGSVTITQATGSVYVNGSNGPHTKIISAIVLDGNGAIIADPSDGHGGKWDNVQFQIVGPAGSDATLTALNAAGQSQTGTSVLTATHNGAATVSLSAGTLQGPVQIRATVDRGDNNVDNQVQDAITATTTVVISDGLLYSLTLTSPGTNAILINRVSTSVSSSSTTIPPDPNGVYSFTVSAHATDRQGTDVLPGTSIRFGSIDTPQANDAFLISGFQGDPQEGGTVFNATDGHFISAGGGAGPGDTLIVFGKSTQGAPLGNDDLESAAKVASVVSNTRLNTVTPFNLNDTTGASVNYGPAIPYLVGRATIGSITSPAFTDALGTATTTLNYPVSALGKAAAIWAQSDSTDNVTGGTKIVTDAAITVFPGVAPAQIIISPSPIPGNLSINVQVCIFDALSSPLSGVVFGFSFTNMGIGSGSVDGVSNAGNVDQATDASGCVVVTVLTNGIAATSGTSGGTSGAPSLTFTAGEATKSAPIVASGNLILLANPSAFGAGDSGPVLLTLLTGNGTPVPGVQLTGTCTATGGTVSFAFDASGGLTNSKGQTTANIVADLGGINTAGSGSCTFTTSTGSPTVTVNLLGQDVCKTDVSPKPTACTSTGGQQTVTVTLVSGGGTARGSVSSAPTGVSCSMSSTTNVSCSGQFATGTSVTLTATPLGGATTVTWSGACSSAGTSSSATVTANATTNCTAQFSTGL